MKAVGYKILFLFLLLSAGGYSKLLANGCTGSRFEVVYSPWCGCWQVCGNYISDCDELVSVSFNFGDGTPSVSTPDPCHVYAQTGTYTVTMTVVAYCHGIFNIFTTTCPITRTVVVDNIAPTLTAGFTNDTTCLGSSTNFTNTTISAPGSNNSYTWIWGDGTIGRGTNPSHTYDTCGAYDVMMIVTNSAPCCPVTGSDTVVHRVYVNCAPFDNSNGLGSTDPYIQESDAQIVTASGACAGDTTRFSVSYNGPITRLLWSFPDSSTSNSMTPWYIYPACPPAIPYTYLNLTTNRNCVGIIDSVTGIFCPSNINLTSTTTLCTGQCSGTATVSMSGGGTPPFTPIWNDPASQTTFTATGLCPGPYNVTVTDGNGCRATPTQPVTVNDFPFPFIGTPTIVGNVLCFGWFGGSANLNYSGGTPPYSVYWDNGATTFAVTGLAGGDHTVVGTDAHGCIHTTIVTIPEPPPVTGTVTTVNAGCNLCNGSATVTPAGGHGTYVYKWFTTPQQTTQTATGLCAGVYLVEVEDATVDGCSDTLQVSISENGSQPVTASATPATCSNICNGTVAANLAPACPGCTFVWFDSLGTSIGQFTGNVSNLCSGTYTVEVTNPATCRSFASATVTIPNPIIPTATASPNTCGGNCNGSIISSGSGGNPTYTYQWYDGSNNIIAGQTNPSISSLCNGTYTVRLTDQSGCTVSESASVYNNQMISNATTTSILCNGECNGMVSVVTTGGRTPYSYLVQDAGSATVYSGASSIIANLCAGSYNVIITDAGNCSLTLPVTMSQPAPINPLTSTTIPLCFGSCNGSVSVAVSGGVAPYVYEWKNSNGAVLPGGTLPAVSNLCAGTYVLQVTDANNCVTPFIPVQFTQPAQLTDTMVLIDPYCTQGQGSIDLTVAGGTTNYSYSWNNGAYTTEDISGLASGTYTVVITDANGCTLTNVANFAQLPPLVTDLYATLYNGYHFKCAGGDEGEVFMNVTGGLPPYTYLWNDSLATTDYTIYGLTVGTYTVTVTDANGCVRIDSITLNLTPPPFFVNEAHTDVTCPNASDGSITITPIGGISPYVFYWQNDTTQFNNQLTGVDSGTYIVNVYDGIFCLIIDTIRLTEPPPMFSSYLSINTTCFGGTDGSIDLTPSGGVFPYTYSWNNGVYNTQDISGLTAGQYIVNVIDSNGCTIADTTVITQPAPMTTSLTVANVSCFGAADGSIVLNCSNGTPPYSFNWNNGLYTTKDIQGLSAGRYVVVVTDNNSCTVTDSADITEPPQLTRTQLITICASDSFFAGGAYQKTPGIYYDTLSPAFGCDTILETTLDTITKYTSQFALTICYGERFLYNGSYYSTSGTYSNTLKSKAGCDSIVTFTLNVLSDFGIYAAPDKATLLIGESLTVNIYNTTSADIVSYTWSPNVGITCVDSICESAVVGPERDTRYTVVAVDSNGCRDTVLIPILVSGPVIFIPNVFTPDGNTANDYFEIFGNKEQLRFLEIKVFDRWGEKVFESNDLNFKWDGTYKGHAMNPAVFVYTLKVVFVNTKVSEKIYKGSVTLLR